MSTRTFKGRLQRLEKVMSPKRKVVYIETHLGDNYAEMLRDSGWLPGDIILHIDHGDGHRK